MAEGPSGIGPRDKELISSFYESFLSTSNILQNVLAYNDIEQLQLHRIFRLKEVVYDAEDLLDELENLKICFPLSISKSDEIVQLKRKLDAIGLEGKKIIPNAPVANNLMKPRARSEVQEDEVIIGREADKEILVAMLLSALASDSSSVKVVSIVGTGGVGKTTLAQLVFHDERVVSEFDLRLWAWVGEDSSLRAVFTSILGGVDAGELDLEGLKEQVQDKIEGKRFLLVVDEVRDVKRHMGKDTSEWNKMRKLLTVGAMGSKILVTTRSLNVEGFKGYNRTHQLEGLSEEDSWNLMKRFAFPPHQEPDAELVVIGKEIAKKCAYLPLAIKLIGRLLYGEKKSGWLMYTTTDLARIAAINPHIMPLLRLIYHLLLPPQFKNCFEFCSIFPKDYVIEKEVLVNMWCALGYLDPFIKSQISLNIEDIGEQLCSELMSKGFFQDSQRDECGKVISFKLNNWMHFLALEKAKPDVLMLTHSNTHELDKKIRHLSISKHASSIHLFQQHYPASRTIRTIFNLKEYVPCSSTHVTEMLSQCRRIRLLDMHGVAMETLPDTFDRVPHLRYLDLSGNEKLEKLPASITNLPCLQVLRLRECKSLKELPENMSKLVKLRTLDIYGCNKLSSMPAGMDKLTSLHTLTMFVMGGDESKQGKRGKLTELKALMNLRGDLLIKVGKFFPSRMWNATKGPYVVKETRLQALEIICDGSSNQADAHRILLESLYPHECLSKIVIQKYQGTKLPGWARWMKYSLPNLVSVTLSDSNGLQHLTTLSQLSHLKYLHLLNLKNLESIEGDAPSELTSGTTRPRRCFSYLEKLVLKWLPNLKGWWRDLTWMEMEAGGGCLVDGNGRNMEQLILPQFFLLRDLRIQVCRKLTYFPPCPSVERLELRGVDEAFCMVGNALPNPVTSVPCNSRDFDLCLKKLIVYYDAWVFNSVLRKSVAPTVAAVDMKYYHTEETLQMAREGFQKCSSSLKNLSIHGFCKLKNLSGGGIEQLTNLQSLSITHCHALDLEEFEVDVEEEGKPWKSLHSLYSLKLDDIPKLVNLPKAFRYLTNLQSLHIKSCGNLKALGECVGFLTSLQSLHIEDCHNLKTLPEGLGSLTSLQSIHVDECNNLKTLPRCLNSLVSRQILHIN